MWTEIDKSRDWETRTYECLKNTEAFKEEISLHFKPFPRWNNKLLYKQQLVAWWQVSFCSGLGMVFWFLWKFLKAIYHLEEAILREAVPIRRTLVCNYRKLICPPSMENKHSFRHFGKALTVRYTVTRIFQSFTNWITCWMRWREKRIVQSLGYNWKWRITTMP